ncbi:hypothetical protein K9M79_07890 [Candidatus Woesearchaeota archaeon]|nr:hypothetical protein [Candidatus Woesearchaeota archaeon]
MKQMFISAKDILSYLSGEDEMDTLITCNPLKDTLITRDYDIYEALTCLEKIDVNRLKKFFENVDVVSYKNVTGKNKQPITHERVEQLLNEMRR